MKTINHDNYIEEAISMYKENVSPSESSLLDILSQIPEQQKLKEGRAVRSPYRWLAMTQMATVFAIIIAVLPSYLLTGENMSNPYYETDKQIEAFEQALDDEDYQNNLRDYSL